MTSVFILLSFLIATAQAAVTAIAPSSCDNINFEKVTVQIVKANGTERFMSDLYKTAADKKKYDGYGYPAYALTSDTKELYSITDMDPSCGLSMLDRLGPLDEICTGSYAPICKTDCTQGPGNELLCRKTTQANTLPSSCWIKFERTTNGKRSCLCAPYGSGFVCRETPDEKKIAAEEKANIKNSCQLINFVEACYYDVSEGTTSNIQYDDSELLAYGRSCKANQLLHWVGNDLLGFTISKVDPSCFTNKNVSLTYGSIDIASFAGSTGIEKMPIGCQFSVANGCHCSKTNSGFSCESNDSWTEKLNAALKKTLKSFQKKKP